MILKITLKFKPDFRQHFSGSTFPARHMFFEKGGIFQERANGDRWLIQGNRLPTLSTGSTPKMPPPSALLTS
jgi:hypothetical protein